MIRISSLVSSLYLIFHLWLVVWLLPYHMIKTHTQSVHLVSWQLAVGMAFARAPWLRSGSKWRGDEMNCHFLWWWRTKRHVPACCRCPESYHTTNIKAQRKTSCVSPCRLVALSPFRLFAFSPFCLLNIRHESMTAQSRNRLTCLGTTARCRWWNLRTKLNWLSWWVYHKHKRKGTHSLEVKTRIMSSIGGCISGRTAYTCLIRVARLSRWWCMIYHMLNDENLRRTFCTQWDLRTWKRLNRWYDDEWGYERVCGIGCRIIELDSEAIGEWQSWTRFQKLMQNAECGMRNAECGMRNAQCAMRKAVSTTAPKDSRLLGLLVRSKLRSASGLRSR